jgi:hypothetical protein
MQPFRQKFNFSLSVSLHFFAKHAGQTNSKISSFSQKRWWGWWARYEQYSMKTVKKPARAVLVKFVRIMIKLFVWTALKQNFLPKIINLAVNVKQTNATNLTHKCSYKGKWMIFVGTLYKLNPRSLQESVNSSLNSATIPPTSCSSN